MNSFEKRLRQDDTRVAERAAEWLTVLERGDAEDNKAFAAWLTESRRHVEEFLFLSAMERVLDRVDSERRLDIDAILARAGKSVVTLPVERNEARAHPTAKTNRRKLGVGIAAGVMLAAMAGWWVVASSWQTYSTALGEQRTVSLPDGSAVHLNTQSRLQVRFTDRARDLRLTSGEGLFDVKRDPLRPFKVDTGSAVVQAVGTQFNIQRGKKGTIVAVLEGAVKIVGQADHLRAGEEVRIVRNGHIDKRETADITRVDAWRQRRLMFRADTLRDIAAEFNRYNRAPQIRIEDDAVGTRRFTGIFNADDPYALVQFLEGYRDLAVEKTDAVLIIRGATT